MTANEYKPVSWNGEAISNSKLNQMCNNTQFLFERNARIRYSGGGITRDTGVKVLAGKTPYPITTTASSVNINVYFGAFFTVGCKPIVTTNLEATSGNMHRAQVVTQGLAGELDHTGFLAVVRMNFTSIYPRIASPGWVHWTAVGY